MKKSKEKLPIIEAKEKPITWTPPEFVKDLSEQETETLNLITDIPETTTSKIRPSMEWNIKIENKPDQRILVVFEPKYERIDLLDNVELK